MSDHKLDLHDIFDKGREIDRSLEGIIQDAIANGLALVEIISGKASNQLKKKVMPLIAVTRQEDVSQNRYAQRQFYTSKGLLYHKHQRHPRSLRPSRIFRNERVRISANDRPVASASCSLMAPQLRPRRK